MIDFNIPTVVTITITSDVVDFQLDGSLGWQEKVEMSYLPPYESTQEKVVDGIVSIVQNVGIVPYNNLALMEDVRDKVESLKAAAIAVVADTLKEKYAVVIKYSESNGALNLITLEVRIAQREDSPSTSVCINNLNQALTK